MVQVGENNIRAEYDFTGGVRGKHYKAMQVGYTVTIHKADGTTVAKDVMPKEGAVVLDFSSTVIWVDRPQTRVTTWAVIGSRRWVVPIIKCIELF